MTQPLLLSLQYLAFGQVKESRVNIMVDNVLTVFS